MYKISLKAVASMAYPGVLILGITLLWSLIEQDVALQYSTYAAVIIGTGFIILFEKLLPNNVSWKPNRDDYKTEALYLSIVQILIPQFVTLFVLFSIYEPLQNWLPGLSGWWPHEWHIAIQFVVLLLIVDFIRYWVHRFAHTIPLLWRLHAVHHSTQKMFWLNTVRFHPLEKVLQLMFDSIPFLLLGVQAEVLATYYVFYALNGFFQHSNIRLNLGVLNYIFSTADLHRWHHSRIPEESNTNYGNNLIVWDLLFGSYYLPKDKMLDELGLVNRNYPLDFSSQMKSPFIDNLDKTGLQLLSWKEILHYHIIKLSLTFIRLRDSKPFMKMTLDPQEAQENVLHNIIHNNKDTRYGDKHQFSHINNYADFIKAVPINEYENLRTDFELEQKSSDAIISAQKPVYYSVTSGTTDKPKFIPLSQDDMKRLKKEQALFSLEIFRSCPAAFMGKMLMISSPAVEGHTESGIPYGSASGLIRQLTPKIFKSKQVIPDAVFDIQDYHARYMTILCFSLIEKNITYLGTANPSSLLKVNELIQNNRDFLTRTIYSGELPQHFSLDKSIRDEFKTRAFRAVTRRQEIVALLKSESTFSSFWPNLRLVNTWTGGSVGIALQAVKRLLPKHCETAELGLISSELRVTFPLAGSTGGLPNLDSAFFEFVERDDWEMGRRRFHLLHQLKKHKQYYLFFTTNTGLYRYAINDIVEVTGFHHQTPLLKFVQKGQGVTNITGEKLYEHQVIDAVQSSQLCDSEPLPFFVLLADIKNAQYQLIVEGVESSLNRIGELSKQIDDFMGSINIEYKAKRSSQRLKPLEIIGAKPGFGEKLKTLLVSNGQREAQYKPKLLWYKNEFPSQLLIEEQ